MKTIKQNYTPFEQVMRLESALQAPSTDFQYVQCLVRIIAQDTAALVAKLAACEKVAEAASPALLEIENFIFQSLTTQAGYQNSDLFKRGVERAKTLKQALAALAAVRGGK
jgi:hypothetical protein